MTQGFLEVNYMKIVKKLMTALLCLTVVVAGMMVPAKANAANAKTFTVHFDGNGWYFKTTENSTWLGIDSIDSYFNAGDSIVVEGNGDSSIKRCEITVSAAVGDVCSSYNATTILYASAGVARAYAAYDGIIIVNGNVDTVMASALGVVQINGNVNVLTADYANGNARYGITGTVNKATAKINSETPDTYYSIVAGKMIPSESGIVWLNEGEFSRTPGAAPSPAPAAPSNNSNNAELDDVPKTGSFVFELSTVLLAAGAVLGAASAVVLFRKKNS